MKIPLTANAGFIDYQIIERLGLPVLVAGGTRLVAITSDHNRPFVRIDLEDAAQLQELFASQTP